MLPLKEAISERHTKAEKMPFNVRMFKGEMSKEDYLLYLHQQLKIYQTLESIGLPHESLRRADAVQQDIKELENEGHHVNTITQSAEAYANYLSSLSYKEALPHIYLNYMAIMFGGQMIKKAVPSQGKMYEFENMKEAIQSIRNVQKDEWADEVNKGFDFNIQIFDELEKLTTS